METHRLRVGRQGTEAMAALVQLKDPRAALLYACLAANPEGCSLEQAAAQLEYSPEEAQRAAQLLLVYGLAADRPKPPPRQKPAFPPQELAQARTADPAFAGLCDYFEITKGDILNRTELETLLNVYQALALPPEVMTLLISDCLRRGRLTAREVEKQAYRWYDLGLDNYESARAYLARQHQRDDRGSQVLELLGIHGRLPGAAEQKYIDQWEEMGVTDELLRLAYDRTLLGAHRLSWPYLHKILVSWRKQGFRTAQEVEAGEQGGRARPAPQPAAETLEAAVLRKMRQKRQQRGAVLEQRREELRQSRPDFAENESALRLCASRMARAKAGEKAALALEYQDYLARQRQLLTELGKPEDWLTDRPDCPLCGDQGYIGTKKCQCLIRACQQAQQASRAGTATV